MAIRDDTDIQTYLDMLRDTGSYVQARRAIRTQKRFIDKLREDDEEFAAAEAEAIEEADDALEAEARRRAVVGVNKGVYFQGKLVEVEVQYSDQLLLALMKGSRSMADRYADRTKNQHGGLPDAPPIAVDDTASAARIASIIANAQARRDAERDPNEV